MRKKTIPITKHKEATSSKKLKISVIEQLKEMPLVTYACQKFGIPKSTFYKWKLIDDEFKTQVENSINIGRDTVNDIAISQLLKKINNGETIPIIFWLKNNSPMFNEKITLEIKTNKQGLSAEELKAVTKALTNMGLENIIKKNGKLYDNFRNHLDKAVDKINSETEDGPGIKIADIAEKMENGDL